MTLSMIENVPVMTTPTASYTVNVLYEGARTSYNISINEVVTVSSIAIKADCYPPQQFTVGDEFSVAGGVLVVTKSNDTREEVNITLAMITNAPNMNEPHENYTVNVSYEGASTSYVINVIPADTRAEVTIGINYDYNGGESVEATDGLNFTEGKSYHFYWGVSPEGARDSVSYKYLKVNDGADPTDLGTEKPAEKGSYIYRVFVPAGDENYKPAEKNISYSIVEPVIKTVTLDKDNVNLSTGTQEIEGVTFNYKGATAAENAVATLTRVAASKPDADDNYIEIATAVNFVGGLRVEFEGINRYVYVYGSYDGTNFSLLDTLTRAKQVSDRVSKHFYIRLVCASAGEESTVTITKVSFQYEVGGVPGSAAARSEYSDLFNTMTPTEEGAYYSETEQLFDSTLSTKAYKMRNQELSGRIHFGFPVASYQARYTKLSFRFKLDSDVTFSYTESGTTKDKTDMSFYARPISDGNKVGINYKINTFETQAEWTTVEFYLGDMMGDDIADVSEINFWINRKITGGFVYIDDFRLIQSTRYPVENTIYTIELVENSVQKTEFEVGDTFVFGGQVKVIFTDYSEETVDESDNRLSVDAPDISTSGTKTVIVTFTYYGVEKSVSYNITVTGKDPKAEETMTIIDDEHDLAKVASRRNPEKDTYMGCAVASDETEVTYNDSKSALKLSGPTPEDYCYFTVVLPETITADYVTVKFFVRNLSSVGNLILQLRDDTEKVKAVYSESNSKADVTTDQSKTNKFAATDAGNDWTYFEHTYYTAGVTAGVKVLRIMFHAPGEKALTADQYCILDGIQVVAAA